MLLQLRVGRVDLERGLVHREDATEVLRLTTRERQLLNYLVNHPSTDLSRKQILGELFGYSPHATTRALDTAVKQLRRKIERDRSQPDHVLTVWGHGYRFEPLQAPAVAGLFGRHEALAVLRARLEAGPVRLVLVGPGGVGKTRLARELVADMDPVVVPLDGAATAHQIRTSVARALPRSDLALPLRVRRLARPLVLDDVEGVAQILGPLIAQWIQAAPDATLVVTSRVPVSIPEGVVHRVEPLDNHAQILLLAHLLERDADEPWLAALAPHLDGLPLAAELVASWAPLLQPGEVLDRVHQLLDAEDTIADVVKRSIELLTPTQQETLRGCACFQRSFTATEVEAVVGRPTALYDLEALRRASLLHATPDGIALLPLVRRATRAQLPWPHAARFAACLLSWSSTSSARWVPDLEEAFRSGDTLPAGVRAALGVRLQERARQVYEEPVEPSFSLRVAELADRAEEPLLAAHAWYLAAAVALSDGAMTDDLLASSRRAATAAGSEVAWVRHHSVVGTAHRLAGRTADAIAALRQAVTLGASGSHHADLAMLHCELGLALRQVGQVHEAVRELERAQRHAERLDDPGWILRKVLQRRGHTLMMLGHLDVAQVWLTQALDLSESGGLEAGAHQLRVHLALLAHEAGDLEGATPMTIEPGVGVESHFHRCVRRGSACLLRIERDDPQGALQFLTDALADVSSRHGVLWEATRLVDGVWKACVGDPGASDALREADAGGNADIAPLARAWRIALDPASSLPTPPTANALARRALEVARRGPAGPAPQMGLHARLVHRWLARHRPEV